MHGRKKLRITLTFTRVRFFSAVFFKNRSTDTTIYFIYNRSTRGRKNVCINVHVFECLQIGFSAFVHIFSPFFSRGGVWREGVAKWRAPIGRPTARSIIGTSDQWKRRTHMNPYLDIRDCICVCVYECFYFFCGWLGRLYEISKDVRIFRKLRTLISIVR